jgi:hypothetical protein
VKEVSRKRIVNREQAGWHGVLLASLAWLPFIYMVFHIDGPIVLWCLGLGLCTALGAAWGAVCLLPKNEVQFAGRNADPPVREVHHPVHEPRAIHAEASNSIANPASDRAFFRALLQFEASNARITRQYGAGLGLALVFAIGTFWAAMNPAGNWAILFLLTLPAIGAATAAGFTARATENDCFDGIEAALFPVLLAHALKFLITLPAPMECLQALPFSLISGLVGAAAGWSIMRASVPAMQREQP